MTNFKTDWPKKRIIGFESLLTYLVMKVVQSEFVIT